MLSDIIKFKSLTATATQVGEETRDGFKAVYWKLRMGDAWTVPVIELTRGEVRGTTIFLADEGRKSAEKEIKALLTTGQRVLAVDPFAFGESATDGKTYLYALLVAAVGDRPLGLEAGQLTAAAHWAEDQFKIRATVQTIGPRSGLVALTAKAMAPGIVGPLKPRQQLETLHDILRQNWTVAEKPELFCFGLLESFDVPQLKALGEKSE